MFDIATRKQVDSALITDGKFTFTGSVDTAVLRRLTIDRLYVNVILENGQITVDMAVPESAQGTLLNDGLSKFLTEMTAIRTAFVEIQTGIRQNQDLDDETRKKQFDENFEQYQAKTNALCTDVFNANRNNVLGAFALTNGEQFLKPDQFDSLYEQAGDIARNFQPLQNIVKAKTALRQTAEGLPFTDFTIENGNLDGSKASLSDYVGKGKYVLVDFWASWCGPCIAEIPVLVEVYNKYKGDKFELLGVAVWEDRANTMKGLETHKTEWSHIIDAGSSPTDLYGIRGIPHIILFGPDGTIVARGLRGDVLKAKVAEVMQ
jgi:thiol-disulfide isomerase/thioredoxin